MNPGIVSADRHDRQIDGTEGAQLRKRIAKRGVTAKNDAMVVSLENVAVVAAIGIAPLARAPMFYAECSNVDLAGDSRYRLNLFPMQFAHVAKPLPTQQITCLPGRDQRTRTIKSERAHVEMIEMRVGSSTMSILGRSRTVSAAAVKRFGADCKAGQPDSNPRKENRICENGYAEKID
jgi:hypothetical protein